MGPGLNAQRRSPSAFKRTVEGLTVVTVHIMVFGSNGHEAIYGTLVQCRQMGWKSTTGHADGPGPTHSDYHIYHTGITNILQNSTAH